MRDEPAEKRCIVFIDAASLHRSAQAVTGAKYPNFDAKKIAQRLCAINDWKLMDTRLYAMVPGVEQSEYWCGFWANKLQAASNDGVVVTSFVNRPAPRQCPVFSQSGSIVDVRMARVYGHEEMIATITIDALRLYNDDMFDVAVFVSRDPALVPLVKELRRQSAEDDVWIKLASATVFDHGSEGYRCIDTTDWVYLSSEDYASCIDRRDHRMSRQPAHA
jgi:uncharacterized LabA/DUF88 family protein